MSAVVTSPHATYALATSTQTSFVNQFISLLFHVESRTEECVVNCDASIQLGLALLISLDNIVRKKHVGVRFDLGLDC